MAPGTPARLLHDCGDLQQDDVVHIIRYDSVQVSDTTYLLLNLMNW